eukprot:1832048-Amphidinium_carterae.1
MIVCDRCAASTRLQDKAVFFKRHREYTSLYVTDKPSRFEKRASAAWAGTTYAALPPKRRRI